VDDDVLHKNPFAFELATVIVNDSVTREAITKDQMRKFLKFVHDDNVYCKYYEVVYILFHTGMRISEFCGWMLKDIDLEKRMLKVASMRLRGQVDALKEMGEDAEGVSTDLTKIQQQVYELTGNKVNIFEDEDTMKSTYQMILEIGEVFDSLNDRSQADLLEVMFGKQRASAGASLLLNYEELEKIKNDSRQ